MNSFSFYLYFILYQKIFNLANFGKLVPLLITSNMKKKKKKKKRKMNKKWPAVNLVALAIIMGCSSLSKFSNVVINDIQLLIILQKICIFRINKEIFYIKTCILSELRNTTFQNKNYYYFIYLFIFL